MQQEPEGSWLDGLYHKYTGTDCDFCQWRLSHELGWEKLWDANCDLTANFALSTQQTADFLVDKNFDTFNDFPDIDATVEKVLVEAEVAGPVSMCSPSAPASTNPPLPTMPTSACAASQEACVQGTSATCVYGSPKSDKAVPRKPRCRLTGQSECGSSGPRAGTAGFCQAKIHSVLSLGR